MKEKRGALKKFYDVKPRAQKKKVSAKTKSSDDFAFVRSEHGFWHGVPVPKPKKRKDHSKFMKFFFCVALVFSLSMIVVGRAYTVSAEVEINAYKAKEHLENGLNLLQKNNYEGAIIEAESAKKYLLDTKINIQSWGQDSNYLKLISPKSKYVEIEKMIGAIDVLLGSSKILDGMIGFYSDLFSSKNISSGEEINLPLGLDRIEASLDSVKNELSVLNNALGIIGEEEIILSRDEIMRFQKIIGDMESSVSKVKYSIIPILKWFSGETSDRRVMILFQNNAEIRGSGGFIGSYAIANFEKNTLKNIDFQTNIYKLDKQAEGKVNIDAPEEYKLLAGGKLYLRDSNYAVDGPESFEAVRKIYEMESGQRVDGIIALDTTLITGILEIIGPIYLEKYQLEVGKDNFLKDIQYEVERDYFVRDGGKEENEPKKILADMMPTFINKTFSALRQSDKRQKIITLISNSVSEKHILLNSSDAQIQDKINQLNYGANVRSNNEYDYIYVHSTNIGGGKSSLNIAESITDNIYIDDFGKIEHSINQTRKHNGTGEWPDHDNINLVRFLLPTEANILQFNPLSGNFVPHMNKKYDKGIIYKMGTEAGRKKISFWMNTSPGESSQVNINYSSPAGLSESDGNLNYYLLIQKEPGTPNYLYHLNILTSERFNIKNVNSKKALSLDILLDSDKLVKIQLEKK